MMCTEVGAGAPVLLLHGLPSAPAELVRLGEALAGFRALVPSMPGYAGAPPSPGQQSVAAIEAALLTLLSERDAADVALVGFSMGAYRAIRLALSGRVRVRSLTLLGGFAGLSSEERDGMRGFAKALRDGVELRGVAGPRMLSKRSVSDADRVRAVEAWLALAPAAVLIEELEDLAGAPSLLDRIGELDIPITLRVGQEDAATPPHHSESIAAQARHAVLEIVPGVGHALLVEDFADTARSVQRGVARSRA
ncbi:MAG TPA: alpha/beta fold hydrolase [Polyangiaceae bacterium]|nr:alpha/beta fold hydrolase [Polyangiaceae bacterium]